MEFKEYINSYEEDPYELSPNENNQEAPIEDWYNEEADYGESWRGDACSDSDFDDEYATEKPEPEPPDRYHTSPTTRSYQKPWIELSDNFYNHGSRVICFSGTENYLRWEEDMDDYFWDYNIREEDKLSYAINTLTGEAYTWWLQEEECGVYYKEPVRTWEDLKWLMYEQYVTRSLTPRNCPKKVLKPLMKQAPISTSLPKSQATPNQGKYYVPIASLDLSCYRCKGHGHVAKFCPTRKTTTKTEPVQHNHDPQVNVKSQTSSLNVSDSFLRMDKSIEQVIILLKSIKEKEILDAKKKGDQALSVYPQVKEKHEIVSPLPNEKVQFDLGQSVFSSKTVLMHLPLSKTVAKNAGTKDDQTDQENTPPNKKIISDQIQTRGEPAPTLITPADHGDECVKYTILMKDDPPAAIPLDEDRGNFLNPQTVQKSNLLYLCAGNQVLRTKLLEEGGYGAVIKPVA